MQDFIQLAASQLGVGSDVAEKATLSVLNILQSKDSGEDGDKLLASIPGAEQLASKAAGGSLGGLAGALGGVSSMLGGAAGSGLGTLAGLQSSGLDTAKIGPFLSMFIEYAKQKAGPELVDSFLNSMPSIKGFLPK